MRLNKTAFVMSLCLAASRVLADVNVLINLDGTAYTDVFVNGSPATKYNIVFLGDGFTGSEQALFNQKVNQAVSALWNLEPYASHMCALNVFRVNVVSNESGVDHPMENIYKDTELDCRYGDESDGEAERCVTSDSPFECYEAASHAPDHSAIFVLVNDEQWGGCAAVYSPLVYSSIHPDFHQIVTHELGHKIGGLADEYTCYVCDGSDDNETYTGSEPLKPNVTKDATCQKWADLIAPATPMPTTVNNPPGVVGAWEGGLYKALGIYRPQFICQMRESEEPFCKVCARHMASTLETYEIEPPNLICSGVLQDLLAFGKMPWTEVGWKFPIPPCLTCPPNELALDEVIYTVQGLPKGFNVQVVNEFGQVVAEGTPDDGGITASFQSDGLTQHYVQVFSDADPTGETLDLASSLFVNGGQQALP